MPTHLITTVEVVDQPVPAYVCCSSMIGFSLLFRIYEMKAKPGEHLQVEKEVSDLYWDKIYLKRTTEGVDYTD